MGKRTCSLDGCDEPHAGLGFCEMHRQRYKKTGDPGPVARTRLSKMPLGATCSAGDCDKAVKARSLCHKHYQRMLRYGSLEIPVRPAPDQKTCNSCGRTLPVDEFSPKRRTCRDCRSAAFREWRLANRERLAEWNAVWYRENRDRQAEYHREYRTRNRELIRNKARIRDLQSKRLRRIDSSLTQAGIAARVDYYGGMCWICRDAPYEHLDHVKPLTKGGPNLLSNIRPACARCNRAKRDRWPFVPAMINQKGVKVNEPQDIQDSDD